jgi:hypothetical protein
MARFQRSIALRTARLFSVTLMVLLVAAICLEPPAAVARDSLAPPGADHRWLPRERWVMLHWLPYDERRLLAILGLPREEVLDWLRDDLHHTLGQLARRRGLRPAAVATRLVVRRSAPGDTAQFDHLRERALRTLTQGHLAQHVLFHYLHQPEVTAHAWEVFGVSPARYQDLRSAGYTPAEIGALQRRSRPAVAEAIERVCRVSSRAGVRAGETPRAQAARFLRRQRGYIAHYLDQALHPRRRQRLGLAPVALRRSIHGGRLRLLSRLAPHAASVIPRSPRVEPTAPFPALPATGSFALWPVMNPLENAN